MVHIRASDTPGKSAIGYLRVKQKTCEAESLALFVKVESTPCCIFQRYTGKIRSYKTSQNYRD